MQHYSGQAREQSCASSGFLVSCRFCPFSYFCVSRFFVSSDKSIAWGVVAFFLFYFLSFSSLWTGWLCGAGGIASVMQVFVFEGYVAPVDVVPLL